ncbi:MAG: cupin, partial [Candidatus Weimeria sp.]
MKEKAGVVFSIAEDNRPVPGCTISKEVYQGDNVVTYFSLAKDTDISAEIHPYGKLLVTADGSMEVYESEKNAAAVSAGDSI